MKMQNLKFQVHTVKDLDYKKKLKDIDKDAKFEILGPNGLQ